MSIRLQKPKRQKFFQMDLLLTKKLQRQVYWLFETFRIKYLPGFDHFASQFELELFKKVKNLFKKISAQSSLTLKFWKYVKNQEVIYGQKKLIKNSYPLKVLIRCYFKIFRGCIFANTILINDYIFYVVVCAQWLGVNSESIVFANRQCVCVCLMWHK